MVTGQFITHRTRRRIKVICRASALRETLGNIKEKQMLSYVVQKARADQPEVYVLTFKLLKKFSQNCYTMLHHRQSGQAATTTRLTDSLLLAVETSIRASTDSCEDFSVKIMNLKTTKGHAEE